MTMNIEDFRKDFYEPTQKYIDDTEKVSLEIVKDIYNLDLIQLVSCYFLYPEERDLYRKQLKDYDVEMSLEEIVEKFKDFPFSMFNLIYKNMKIYVPTFYYDPYKTI